MLFNLHAMAASFVNVDKLAIDKDEAKQLADAINEVNKFYNIAFDPKKVAIFNLCVVAGKIYGTRLVAVYVDRKATKAATGDPASAAAPTAPGPTLVKQNRQADAPPRPVSEMSPSDLFAGAMETSGAL